ncbi:hypothetical protein [Acinetobacter soli]|uniref:hypothetical protein n=1 Tax=Acinetobacter soli TaxID=487316 RepID=UPI001250A7C2|nr:hypothetical protein [Acinetobacter soli]
MKNLAQKIDITKETVKEHPILFNTEMVKAILEGRKTQTRRVMKEQPPSDDWLLAYVVSSTERKNEGKRQWVRMNKEKTLQLEAGPYFTKPYQIGDRLWVRETTVISPPNWLSHDDVLDHPDIIKDSKGEHRVVQYIATNPDTDVPVKDYKLKKTPSIHMPRWASRILLEITNVRVEHLNDISEEDSIAEGVESIDSERDVHDFSICSKCGGTRSHGALGHNLGWIEVECRECDTHKKRFESFWESINGEDSWDVDPWVWVIEFRVIEGGR